MHTGTVSFFLYLRQDLDLDDLLGLIRVLRDGDRRLARRVQPRTVHPEYCKDYEHCMLEQLHGPKRSVYS